MIFSRSSSVVSWNRMTIVTFVLATLLIGSSTTHGLDLGNLIRQLGRVADDVPLNKVDDVAEELSTSKAGREVLERAGVRVDDAVERSRGLTRLLRETVGETNPAILKQLDALDEPAREAALVLSRGARGVGEAIPDLAIRSQFLRDGGVETVAALGRHPDLIDDALAFDIALRAGRLPSPVGMRAVTLEDFGHFVHAGGNRAHRFWKSSVSPHWKLWLGGSALTAVLLSPDEYLDEIGNLTEDGLEKIGNFGGELLVNLLRGALTGIGEGSKEVVRESAGTVARIFLTDAWGLVTLVLLILIVAFLTRGTWFGIWGRFKAPKKRD